MTLRLAGCLNPGVIGNCLYCNACGRVNKDTMLHDRLIVYENYLRKMMTFMSWNRDIEIMSGGTVKDGIERMERKIAETIMLIETEWMDEK